MVAAPGDGAVSVWTRVLVVLSCQGHSSDVEAAYDLAGDDQVDGNSRGGTPSFRSHSGQKENKLLNRLEMGLIARVLLLAMPVLAQNNTVSISGRVTEPSGAVVPTAQITNTQTATNVDAVSATNSDGLFRVPSLIDGPYKVTVCSVCRR